MRDSIPTTTCNDCDLLIERDAVHVCPVRLARRAALLAAIERDRRRMAGQATVTKKVGKIAKVLGLVRR